jgi:hypothetical protein
MGTTAGSRAGKVAAIGCGGLFGAIWIIGWSAGTLLFDVMAVRGIVMQARSNGYRSAQGTVLESRVDVSRDSEGGTSYTPKVKYAYTVNGRRHEGNRMRYGMQSSGRKRAQAFVQAHSPGTALTVYYDPAEPSESVLETGVGGTDLYMFLFLTPFNIIMVGSWVVAAGCLGGIRAAERRFMRRVRHRAGGVIIVRLPGLSPGAVAGITALAISSVLIFVVGFSTWMRPSIGYVAVALGVVVVGAARAGWKSHERLLAGERELEINPVRRTITFPLRKRKSTRTTIRFDQIDGVEVKRTVKTGDESTTVRFVPAVKWTHTSGTPHTTGLGQFDNEAEARAMREWLIGQIGQIGAGERVGSGSSLSAPSPA